MSRFASNSNTTKQYTRGGGDANTLRGQRKGTVMANFRPDVNQKITSSTKLREGARQFVATNRVKGGETPTCQGHVNVERGSGLALLSKINTKGTFTGNAQSKKTPINREIRRKASRAGVNLNTKTNTVEVTGYTSTVLERRKLRGKNSAWNDHVEGLATIADEKLNAKKIEYEDRRQYIREILDSGVSSGFGLRKEAQGQELYTPKNIASQHAIAMGTPSSRRAEWDARRVFLKSGLSEDERKALAKSRGESRAAAFGLDGTN